MLFATAYLIASTAATIAALLCASAKLAVLLTDWRVHEHLPVL